MAKYRFFKLSSKATTFVDPKSQLKLVNHAVERVEKSKAAHSQTLKDAIEGGHIKEVEEKDYNEYQASIRKVKALTDKGKIEEAEEIFDEMEEDAKEEEMEEREEEEDEEEEVAKPKKGKAKGKAKGKK